MYGVSALAATASNAQTLQQHEQVKNGSTLNSNNRTTVTRFIKHFKVSTYTASTAVMK
jgi:hypothetical protein